MHGTFSETDISRIIEMAWEDRTPFEAIERCYGIDEQKTIRLMRRHMQRRSFKLWRTRVTGRKTKHTALRSKAILRAYCPSQYKRQ